MCGSFGKLWDIVTGERWEFIYLLGLMVRPMSMVASLQLGASRVSGCWSYTKGTRARTRVHGDGGCDMRSYTKRARVRRTTRACCGGDGRGDMWSMPVGQGKYLTSKVEATLPS